MAASLDAPAVYRPLCSPLRRSEPYDIFEDKFESVKYDRPSAIFAERGKGRVWRCGQNRPAMELDPFREVAIGGGRLAWQTNSNFTPPEITVRVRGAGRQRPVTVHYVPLARHIDTNLIEISFTRRPVYLTLSERVAGEARSIVAAATLPRRLR